MNKPIAIALIISLTIIILLSGCIIKKGSLQDRFMNQDGGSDSNGSGSSGSGSGASGSGSGSGSNNQPVNLTLDQNINKCLEEPIEAKKDTCLMDVARIKKSDLPCPKLTFLSKDRCYVAVGEATKDDEYCKKIADPQVRDDCFHTIGLLNNKAETCAQILNNIEFRDECYDNAARKAKNADLCKKIFDPNPRDYCLIAIAKASKNASICDGLSTRMDAGIYIRDKCYADSKAVLNGEQCAKIVDAKQRALCFKNASNTPESEINCSKFSDTNSVQNCYYWYGSNTGSFEICKKITDLNKMNTCLDNAITINPTIEICNQLKGADYKTKNQCFKDVAMTATDEKLCDNILSDSKLRDSCIADIAVEKEDIGMCFDLKENNIAGRDDCIRKIALNTGDYSFCEQVQTDQAYYRCYADIALSFKAPEICGFAQRSDLRLLPYTGKEWCYKEYAVETQDEKICKNITYSSLVKTCKSDVEIAVVCQDNDNKCDEELCTFVTDNDCKPPSYCTADLNCNDYTTSTTNKCNKSTHKCEFTVITNCINNDNYCPQQCTFVGDPEKTTAENNKTNEDTDCVNPEGYHPEYIDICEDADGECPEDCSFPGDARTTTLQWDTDCPIESCEELEAVICSDLGEEWYCVEGNELIAQEEGCCALCERIIPTE